MKVMFLQCNRGCSKISKDNTCPYSYYNGTFSHNKALPKSNCNQNQTGIKIMKIPISPNENLKYHMFKV